MGLDCPVWLLAGFCYQFVHHNLWHTKLAPEAASSSAAFVVHLRVVEIIPPQALVVIEATEALVLALKEVGKPCIP
jgi:hypothetical protein